MLDVETLGAALKLVKEGGGGGGEGAPIIDDSKILTSTTWSSQKIVDTLCPPFTASGSVVQCTPVENSPLGVQVEITPTQEGTGDPSLENVRPIVGWDAVNVWRGGNNMLDMDEITIPTGATYGLEMEKIGNYIRIHGTSIETGISSFAIAYTNQNYLCGKGFVFSWFTNESSVISVYGLRTVSEKNIAIQMNLQEGQVYDFTLQIALGVQKLTAYEPYRGKTFAIDLGQTVYGGRIDTKEKQAILKWKVITLTNSTPSISVYRDTGVAIGEILDFSAPEGGANGLCSHAVTSHSLTTSGMVYGWTNNTLYWINILSDLGLDNSSVNAFKQYLGDQKAAGTPVDVCVPLANPIIVSLDELYIPALSGTNTLYANAGGITVTGASDPIATITALQDRVSALESAALN